MLKKCVYGSRPAEDLAALFVGRKSMSSQFPVRAIPLALGLLLAATALSSQALAAGGNGGAKGRHAPGEIGGIGGGDGADGATPSNGGALSLGGAGGGGGGAGGGNGADGDAGNTPAGAGGAGGTIGTPDGAAGISAPGGSGSNTGGGGGGGGGGYNGNGAGGAIGTNTLVLQGGAGGNGGNGGGATGVAAGGGGGGGAGGYGAIATGGGVVTNTGSMIGGAGGAGGAGGNAATPGATFGGSGGGGGDGGIGLSMSANMTLNNQSIINGGNGGAAGPVGSGGGSPSPTAGQNGTGGAGVVGAGLTVINSGTITGGMGGDGVTRANAITFTGGANTLTLQNGSAITGNIAIDGSGGLTFNQSTAQTLSNVITGNGSVIQNGTGKLTLTGANTYSGGTTITAGAIGAGNNSALGTGAVTLDGGALQRAGINPLTLANAFRINTTGGTIDAAAEQLLLTGAITDGNGTGGALTILSTGGGSGVTFASSGVNTYGGATIIGDGTGAGAVALLGSQSNAFSVNSAVTVTAHSFLDVGDVSQTIGSLAGAGTVNASGIGGVGTLVTGGDNSSTTFSGLLSNGGATLALTKTGTGTMTLTGTNAYSGATTINSGTLAGGAANTFSAASAMTLNTGGTLDLGGFAQSINAVALAGGTLTNGSLTGAVTSTGGTINGISGAATLTTTSGTTVLSGNNSFTGISGSAALTMTGGTTILSGNGGFTGSTTIQGGNLSVNGTLGGSIAVNNGGVLKGTGTVGTTTIATGGAIAPGNSIGTLTVAGDLTLALGATYQVEANASGGSDRIDVTGTATLNGATLAVDAGAGNWGASTGYTIINAGNLVGQFGTVTSNLAFLDPTVSYDATVATLTLQRNDVSFASIGRTANQRGVATVLQPMGGGALYNAILPLDVTMALSAFDQLSGELHASMKSVLIEDSKFVRNAVLDRMDEAYSGDGTRSMTGTDMQGDTSSVAIWGQAFGGWQQSDGETGISGVRRDIGGFVTGVDGEIVDNWRLGIVGGYSQGSVNVPDRASSANSDNYYLGIYGGAQWDALSFRGGIANSWSQMSSHRSVGFGSFADRVTAAGDAGTFQAFGELAYRFDLDAGYIEPFANLAHVSLHTDPFTENGGAAALSMNGDTMNSTYTTIGLRSSTQFAIGAASLTAHGLLGWRHAFGDATPSATGRFAGSDAFTVVGATVAQNSAVVEAGLDLSLSQTSTLGIAYQGQFGSGTSESGLKASFAMKF